MDRRSTARRSSVMSVHYIAQAADARQGVVRRIRAARCPRPAGNQQRHFLSEECFKHSGQCPAATASSTARSRIFAASGARQNVRSAGLNAELRPSSPSADSGGGLEGQSAGVHSLALCAGRTINAGKYRESCAADRLNNVPHTLPGRDGLNVRGRTEQLYARKEHKQAIQSRRFAQPDMPGVRPDSQTGRNTPLSRDARARSVEGVKPAAYARGEFDGE